MLEEAAKRDHRKLGREMDLFHMQEEAPGQVFWHPNGWTIYTELQDYMRRQQRAGGYVEVNTPQVVDRKLWEASGHWEKYQEHMFIVEVDEEHAREKADQRAQADELPLPRADLQPGPQVLPRPALRMAEFGSCNRYEPSGALHGIMRVRGFTQDDGHIFCTEDQIEAKRRNSSTSCRRSTKTSASRIQGEVLRPPRHPRRLGRGLGQGRSRAAGGHPRRRDRAGAEPRRRARSTAPSWNSC
jgi:threonyl-tRNA synthetase